MGWVYFHKRDGVSALEALKSEFGMDKPDADKEVVRSIVRLNAVYLAVRAKKDGVVRAYVVAINRAPSDHHNFGYKDMSEDMHPLYYDVPNDFLDLLSPVEPDSSASRWRAAVRARNVRKSRAKELNDGAVVRFPAPLHFRDGEVVQEFIAVKHGRKLLFRKNDESGALGFGSLYRISNLAQYEYEVLA